MTLQEALPKLRAPFTPAAVKWKIQTNPKKYDNGGWGKATIVAFIDARLVAERLNDVAQGDWSTQFRPADQQGGVICSLTVFGKTREDVGYGVNERNVELGMKTRYSDALKRAAVHFGIGAPLYAMRPAKVAHTRLYQSGDNWYLPDELEGWLSEQYALWLKREDILARFGEPIDHGDVA